MPGTRPGTTHVKQLILLFDLGLAKFDVLFRDWIVFLFHQLVGHGARVLARDIIKAGIGAGYQFHLDCDALGHDRTSIPASGGLLADNLVTKPRMSRKGL